MASIYKRPDSRFWWVSFRGPDGKIHRESTGYRIDVGPETRRARELEARKTLDERGGRGAGGLGAWNEWVLPWFEQRVGGRTLGRYRTGWRMIELFLEQNEILSPRQLTREHCFRYPSWRMRADKRNGKYIAGMNTARLELKILGMVMKEAVWRGYAPANPCRELGLKAAARKVFPEYTDEQMALIEEAANREPKPRRSQFRNSFLIARYHGVRLNETNVNPMTDVKLWTDGAGVKVGSIRFVQKGGKVRTKPLHPKLVPLFEELQRTKATHAYPPPSGGWGNRWTRFLHRIGIKNSEPNACFHSLRVTVKSRLRRAGIDKETAMEYLSHEAADVDESYNRFTLDDLRQCHAAL